MPNPRLENWAKIRAKGQKRFVFVTCALGWGLTTGVIWSVAMAAMQGWHKLPLLLSVALVGFPVGGLFMGWWTWRTAEKRYAEALKEEASGK